MIPALYIPSLWIGQGQEETGEQGQEETGEQGQDVGKQDGDDVDGQR